MKNILFLVSLNEDYNTFISQWTEKSKLLNQAYSTIELMNVRKEINEINI